MFIAGSLVLKPFARPFTGLYSSMLACKHIALRGKQFFVVPQTEEEIEEKESPAENFKKASREDVILAPGFVFSNLISIFIMISTGAVLTGTTGIKTAADAARGLEPLAGGGATLLFAVGIVGAGFLAVPVLATSSAYAVAELFGWRESLSAKLHKAKGFYFIITSNLKSIVAIFITHSLIRIRSHIFIEKLFYFFWLA